jgi:hypothetical protein
LPKAQVKQRGVPFVEWIVFLADWLQLQHHFVRKSRMASPSSGFTTALIWLPGVS